MSTAQRYDLVQHLRTELGMTHASARIALDTVLEGVAKLLQKEQRVAFSGFGTFQAYERGPLNRYDMNHGENRTLPAKMRIRFTPSPKLLARMNEGDPSA